VINDCMTHILNGELPFGGVGASGQLSLHGEIGFNNCSHLKPVLYSDNFNGFPTNVKYPPFTKSKGNMLDKVAKIGNVYKKQIGKKIAQLVFAGVAAFSFYHFYFKKHAGDNEL
jgi:aldehyde dehydrogenase (NAD+)